MSQRREPPQFLWDLFQELRRRRFLLGPDDWVALWLSLRAGFGWESRQALLELCTSLWAKSHREAEILASRFPLAALPEWDLAAPPVTEAPPTDVQAPPLRPGERAPAPVPAPAVSEMTLSAAAGGALPPLPASDVLGTDSPFVFVPQYPVSERETAQAWRRLRRAVRVGPPTELDVEATVDRRSRLGVVSPPVLVARRRNLSRLLVLIDRQGSMAPYHAFVDQVSDAIRTAASLDTVEIRYFHDVPVEGADTAPLETPAGDLTRVLDGALPSIEPDTDGFLFEDPACRRPVPINDVLKDFGTGGSALFISDAGAARGSYDVLRLLNTVAFLKGLRDHVPYHVWLNPVPEADWTGSTAAQLARHSPMFPMTSEGMHGAVNVLRGQPLALERSL